jgi:hypothetical protein
MMPVPKDGTVLILPPGKGEIQFSAAEVKLQFQILRTQTLPLRRAGLKPKAAILVVRS